MDRPEETYLLESKETVSLWKENAHLLMYSPYSQL